MIYLSSLLRSNGAVASRSDDGGGLTQTLNISQYPVCNIFCVMQDVLSRYADGFNTPLGEFPLPPTVILRSHAHIVRHTVNLDRQLGRGTIEIHDMGADRMLAAEFYAQWFLAKLLP